MLYYVFPLGSGGYQSFGGIQCFDRETLGEGRLALLLLARMLALMAVSSVFDPTQVEAQQSVGSARIVVNNVTSTRPASAERIVLRVGSSLVQNEVIDTAPNSGTFIVFEDNAKLAICPPAEVVLKVSSCVRNRCWQSSSVSAVPPLRSVC